MNGWSEVTRMLAANKELRELLIVPNAPPVSQGAGGRMVLGSQTFSAADVAETLVIASSHASGRRAGDLGQAGVLCLGVRDIGRISIFYFTQRGSRALRIVRVPFNVPTIDAICVEPLRAREVVQAVETRRCKTVLICGPTRMANGQLTYALLAEVNRIHREVILIAERMLSFLLTHDNSVVIQMEVPTDVPSMEDAILHALLVEPDIVCLGNVRATDDLSSLPQLINAGRCTILSTVSETPTLLLEKLPKTLRRSLGERGDGMLLSVRPGDDGRLHLAILPWSALSAPE